MEAFGRHWGLPPGGTPHWSVCVVDGRRLELIWAPTPVVRTVEGVEFWAPWAVRTAWPAREIDPEDDIDTPVLCDVYNAWAMHPGGSVELSCRPGGRMDTRFRGHASLTDLVWLLGLLQRDPYQPEREWFGKDGHGDGHRPGSDAMARWLEADASNTNEASTSGPPEPDREPPKGGRPRLPADFARHLYLQLATKVWLDGVVPTYDLMAKVSEPHVYPETLRGWKKRYGLPRPSETPRPW